MAGRPIAGQHRVASATTARIIGRVDGSGNVDTTTALNAFSANNPRSVATPDGVNLWIDGANSGVLYTTLGNASFTTLGTNFTNLRQIGIFGSQLYVSSSSSTLRLGQVGTGLPTMATQTITGLPGFATSGGSPYGFFFTTLNGGTGPDTLYVADDGATPAGPAAGLTKYSLVGGNWTTSGTVGGAADAYRSVAGVVSGTSVTLYATGNGTKLVTITDSSGYNGTFSGTPTSLATAATNEAFRGVALAPQ